MSIEDVRALVAERQRYDDWLAALEAKRAETPPRVFERVHGDYTARRSGVIANLQTHVGALAAMVEELSQRLGGLDAKLAAHEEELAEGMLRNLVGEYDNDRWDSVRRDIEAGIDTLGTERQEVLTEVEDVRALLASAEVVPPEPPAPVVAETPVPEFAAHENSVLEATPLVIPAVDDPAPSTEPSWILPEVETPAVATLETAPDAAPDAVADTELNIASEVGGDALLDIDVQGMVDNPVPAGPSHEEVLADVAALFDTSSIAAVPEPPTASNEVDDALAMFGEVTGPADQQFVQSLQGIEAEHDARPDVSTATVTPAGVSLPGNAVVDPFDDLAFLRSVIDQPAGDAAASNAASPSAPTGNSAEPQKTLRCTECGTLNLPTEWYCERCGGELAAF